MNVVEGQAGRKGVTPFFAAVHIDGGIGRVAEAEVGDPACLDQGECRVKEVIHL